VATGLSHASTIEPTSTPVDATLNETWAVPGNDPKSIVVCPSDLANLTPI
jgi:hypothetical protein